MANDYFSGAFTEPQIDAINSVKTSFQEVSQEENIQGDTNIFLDDVDTYKEDKTTQTDNQQIIGHIENTMGSVDDFLTLLDVDGDGEYKQEEWDKLCALDNNSDFSYKDIDELAQNILNIEDATVEKDGKEVNYKADSEGLLKEDNKINNPLNLDIDNLTYETDDSGNISSITDKDGNKTVYTYTSDGEIISSKKYIGDKEDSDNNLINESFYEKGENDSYRVKEMKEHISEITGLKSDTFHQFEYDDKGRVTTSTIYQGSSATGNPIGVYDFKYEGDTDKVTTRTNRVNNEIGEYKYDENQNLEKIEYKDAQNNVSHTDTYDTAGKIISSQQNDEITTYEYDNGLRTKSSTYKCDASGNKSADALSQSYYDDGKIKSVQKGEFTYVYKDGSVTPTIYSSEDCINGEPKAGAKEVSNIAQSSSSSLDNRSSSTSSSANLFTNSKITTQYLAADSDMPYLLLAPENADPNQELPVIVYLHGSGEVGGGEDQLYHTHGPGGIMTEEAGWDLENFNGYVICPHLTSYSDWSGDAEVALRSLLDDFNSTHKTGKSVIMGASLGGSGASYMAKNMGNEYFDEAVVISGYDSIDGVSIPIQGYYGEYDDATSIGIMQGTFTDNLYSIDGASHAEAPKFLLSTDNDGNGRSDLLERLFANS